MIRFDRQHDDMFTIEHEFDSTVVTLIDDGNAPFQEDVIVNSFTEHVTVQQYDPRTDKTVTITLSHVQVQNLGAALDLPEGIYAVEHNND